MLSRAGSGACEPTNQSTPGIVLHLGCISGLSVVFLFLRVFQRCCGVVTQLVSLPLIARLFRQPDAVHGLLAQTRFYCFFAAVIQFCFSSSPPGNCSSPLRHSLAFVATQPPARVTWGSSVLRFSPLQHESLHLPSGATSPLVSPPLPPAAHPAQ